MTLRHLSAIALIGATTLTFGACGTKTVNTGNVESALSAKLKEAGAKNVSVSCPDDVEAKAGATFKCTAEAEGDKATYTVTQKDDNGNVSWALDQ